MKALTILQPWADAILRLGKDVENRTWPTKHRGPLLIHAGKSRRVYADKIVEVWRQTHGIELAPADTSIFGAILGVTEVVDCIQAEWILPERIEIPGYPPSVWAEGPWCWMLRNPQQFQQPIPFLGSQGLFTVPDDLVSSEFRE